MRSERKQDRRVVTMRRRNDNSIAAVYNLRGKTLRSRRQRPFRFYRSEARADRGGGGVDGVKNKTYQTNTEILFAEKEFHGSRET